jgi:hypothetical protein
MNGIRFELEGELIAEPYPSGLTIEYQTEFAEEHGHDDYDPGARPGRNLGRFADGVRFTILRVKVSDEQWVEITARSKLAERVALLERGSRIRVVGRVTGTSAGGPGGFLHLEAGRVRALQVTQSV